MRVSDIMTKTVITVPVSGMVRDAFAAMYNNEIRHVPVLNTTGALIGIVTDRDLKEHMGAWLSGELDPEERADALDDSIEGVMTANPITVGPETELSDLIDLLLDQKFSGVPVVGPETQLMGIVSYLDVLRAVRELV